MQASAIIQRLFLVTVLRWGSMGLAAFPIFLCSAQMPMPYSDDEVLGNQTEGEL